MTTEKPNHPVLNRWLAEVCEQAEDDNHRRSERAAQLLDRLAWACSQGRLTWKSFGEALDRALEQALRKHDGGPTHEPDVEVTCGEPGLLPRDWLDQHGGIEIATSFWEDPHVVWMEADFDRICLTVFDDSDKEATGLAFAAPDGFTPAQQNWFDVLRGDGLDPVQAARRTERLMVSRSQRLHHGRSRQPYRRARSRRFPSPHPVLAGWLLAVRAESDPDLALLRQLEWAANITGCLSEEAFSEAVRRAIDAARTAGVRGRYIEVWCARIDLVPRRSAHHWIIMGRSSGVQGSVAIDQVVVHEVGVDEAAGSAFARPAGLRPLDIAEYEAHRAAGVEMNDAFRRVADRRRSHP